MEKLFIIQLKTNLKPENKNFSSHRAFFISISKQRFAKQIYSVDSRHKNWRKFSQSQLMIMKRPHFLGNVTECKNAEFIFFFIFLFILLLPNPVFSKFAKKNDYGCHILTIWSKLTKLVWAKWVRWLPLGIAGRI